MNEKVKKKNKIIGISLGLLIVLVIVISSTYAYWQITAHQEDTNILKAACLDFEVDFTTGITLQDEWPLPVEDALRDLTGYKFTITNNCDSEVNYSIGLESLNDAKITNYMSENAIALALDDNYLGTYNNLRNLTGPTKEPRASKELQTTTLGKGEVKEHILKIWIEKNASIDEQSKGFVGKLFITGGPEIKSNVTADKCFTMDETTGEILAYDVTCGTSVVIPAKVGTTAVKSIDSKAFKDVVEDAVSYSPSGEIIDDIDKSSMELGVIIDEYDFADMEPLSEPKYAIIYNKAKETEYREFAANMEINVYLYDDPNLPSKTNGSAEMFMTIDSDEPGVIAINKATIEETVIINSLDLSQAYNLQRIEERAFSNVPSYVDTITDLDNYPISLTYLNFGNNMNLEIGPGAFSRIDVPELTLYASFVPGKIKAENPKEINIGYFGLSEIDNLIIKPGNTDVLTDTKYTITYNGESTELSFGIYLGIKAAEMKIDEGIKEIRDNVFSGAFGLILNTGAKLTLPNSLTKIGDYAFHNSPFNNVYLGTGLSSVGKGAFNGMTSSQTIHIPKTQAEFESSTTRGDNWSDEATIQYSSTRS